MTPDRQRNVPGFESRSIHLGETGPYITDMLTEVTEVWGRGETLVPLLATAFYNTNFWR
jgi:hypothetical protein